MLPEIVVYIKEDCHLCEKLLEELYAAIAGRPSGHQHRVILRDIEDSDAWYATYREYVPVIVVNGEEVCHYFFDQQEFEQALS